VLVYRVPITTITTSASRRRLGSDEGPVDTPAHAGGFRPARFDEGMTPSFTERIADSFTSYMTT